MGTGPRRLAAVLVVSALAAMHVVTGACGSDSEESSGEPATCEDLLVATPCFDCLETSCCEEVRSCIDDAPDGTCSACVQGTAETDACLESETTVALFLCAVGKCDAACGETAPAPKCDAPAEPPSGGSCAAAGEGVACNPLTNAECDGGGGEVCDYDTTGFRCFPGPNELDVCEPCGGEAGFCGPGLSCFRNVLISPTGVELTGVCARACCDDEDCGGGTCAAKVTAGAAKVGVCLEAGATE